MKGGERILLVGASVYKVYLPNRRITFIPAQQAALVERLDVSRSNDLRETGSFESCHLEYYCQC